VITHRPRARLDLLEQFVYLGEQAGVEIAERYFDAVSRSCAHLARFPESGAIYDCGIAGVRRFPIKGFENHLIFYVALANGIEVIRVLHGARDLDRLFDEGER